MMKKLLFILIAMLSVTSLFAMQVEPEVLDTSFSAIKSIFLPAIISAVLVLFADARKHFLTPEWSWAIFFNTKAKPFLITTIGGIVLYLIIAFLPFTQQFIEVLADSPLTEITAAGFFGMASGIIDGFTKPRASA